MDSQEFKVRGRQMVDYIIQYLEVSDGHMRRIWWYGSTNMYQKGDRDPARDARHRAGLPGRAAARLAPARPGALGGRHEGRGGQDHGRHQ